MRFAEAKVDFPVTRVIAALDAVCQPTDALASAAEIAARCHVELVGLFIEDDSLFRLTSTPAARHVSLTSVGGAPFEADMLQAETRLRIERAAAALREAAHGADVPCSFRAVRGMPSALLGAATMAGDLIVLPAEASIPGLPLRPHSPLLGAVGAVSRSALVVRRRGSRSRPLVVASADRHLVGHAIAAVRRLQLPNHDAVDVVIPGIEYVAACRALEGLEGAIRVREVRDLASQGVIDLANALGSDILVLAGRAAPLRDSELSDELLRKADRQVLLVRG